MAVETIAFLGIIAFVWVTIMFDRSHDREQREKNEREKWWQERLRRERLPRDWDED